MLYFCEPPGLSIRRENGLILFVSDIHFGRADATTERAKEAALVACLRAHEQQVERLYLLGDVFEHYIEYRHLVPKGFVRFQALLAEWTDRGVPVTYLVGNHDPWHRDYFEKELGVRVVFDALNEPLFGINVYMAHGDGIARTEGLYRLLKRVLRHPVPVALYRTLLPGDLGLALARWVSRNRNHTLKDAQIEALRQQARRLLHEQSADVVIMGHTHYPELITWPEGRYLNTGFWHKVHTFATLDANGLRLLHWNGTCSEELSPAILQAVRA